MTKRQAKASGANTGRSYRLNERQKAFVRGMASGLTATEAARRAGYSKAYADREAKRLVEKPQVRTYLAELNEALAGPEIATAEERQALWTRVLRDPRVAMRWRLKASELLGRSAGDFGARLPPFLEEFLRKFPVRKLNNHDLDRVAAGEGLLRVLLDSAQLYHAIPQEYLSGSEQQEAAGDEALPLGTSQPLGVRNRQEATV